MMTTVLSTSRLLDRYRSRRISILTRSSFEERWVKCINSLSSLNISTFTVFCSEVKSLETLKTFEDLDHRLLAIMSEITLPAGGNAEAYGIIRGAVERAFEVGVDGTVLIDVSSFKRDELLIVLSILGEIHPSYRKINCELLYLEASEMSDDWLSRNTLNVRTVLGYSGDPRQSKKTCVVVMVGHELIRAKDIIDAYEPSKVMIGKGIKAESINPELYSRNEQFYRELKSYYGSSCEEFEFSLLDPIKVKNTLKSLCGNSQYNYVVAPLNNKISCIGAGLFALENQDIQIGYSDVLEYNRKSYSVPGSNVHILSVNEILWVDQKGGVVATPSEEAPSLELEI
ncbi:MAG: hypothetical protein OEZ47_07355 [Gammaproteobacteria bacterium]|nr:hypothetical protein [Gammaproteobacteria bacterium]